MIREKKKHDMDMICDTSGETSSSFHYPSQHSTAPKVITIRGDDGNRVGTAEAEKKNTEQTVRHVAGVPGRSQHNTAPDSYHYPPKHSTTQHFA